MPPCGGDRKSRRPRMESRHFNPRTPHGVRPSSLHEVLSEVPISIHAPLTGCDLSRVGIDYRIDISIHAPLTGCDVTVNICGKYVNNFNPRTPHGVRLKAMAGGLSHAIFQSTHPSRGATDAKWCISMYCLISIHAPLTGCDCHPSGTPEKSFYFNPRTPHGVRQQR